MIEKYDGIEETLNVETEIVPTEKTSKPKKRTERVIDIEKDIKKDYDYTRGQLYDVIEKGQEALSGILDVANNTDHPRAYEVAGQLVKSVSDAAEKLVALQQKMQDLEEGGLNEKGRKSYERENPGSDLKAPTKKKGNPRRKSFCARMRGMKKKLTSKKTARDPDSRINKSLRKWDC